MEALVQLLMLAANAMISRVVGLRTAFPRVHTQLFCLLLLASFLGSARAACIAQRRAIEELCEFVHGVDQVRRD